MYVGRAAGASSSGERPLGRIVSSDCFVQRQAVNLLVARRAEVAERRVQAGLVVDLLDKAREVT